MGGSVSSLNLLENFNLGDDVLEVDQIVGQTGAMRPFRFPHKFLYRLPPSVAVQKPNQPLHRFLELKHVLALAKSKQVIWFGEYHSEKRICILLEQLVRTLSNVPQNEAASKHFFSLTDGSPKGKCPYSPTTGYMDINSDIADGNVPVTRSISITDDTNPANHITSPIGDASGSSTGPLRDLHIIFEHFSIDMQELLDRFMNKRISFQEMCRIYKEEYGTENHDLEPYKEMLEYCRDHNAISARKSKEADLFKEREKAQWLQTQMETTSAVSGTATTTPIPSTSPSLARPDIDDRMKSDNNTLGTTSMPQSMPMLGGGESARMNEFSTNPMSPNMISMTRMQSDPAQTLIDNG